MRLVLNTPGISNGAQGGFPLDGSLRKNSPAAATPFSAGSETDKRYIADLLQILEESSNAFGLFRHLRSLDKINREIGHLHPFAFLHLILTDPSLRAQMQRIYGIDFKRAWVMDDNILSIGFRTKLDSENRKENLEPYIDTLAASLRVPPEEIRQWVRTGAWTNLCIYLLEKTSSQADKSCPA